MSNRSIALALTTALAACGGSPPAAAPRPPGDVAAPDTLPRAVGAPAAGSDEPAALPAFPADPFRAEMPKAGAERPFQLPKVKRFALGPSIDAYLIEDHDLPVVSIDLNMAGGAMNDPAGQVGRAQICMNMLTEGTERLEKIAYNEALADLASSVSSYASDDRQGVALNTLKRNFAPTFALFTETITTPGFRQVDFDRMIKRSYEALKQAKASPGSVGARVVGAVLYGLSHPLGRVVTEATLGKLSLADCKAYHAAYVKPKGARLFVAGDITEAEVRQAFEPLLAAWKGAPKRSIAMPRPTPPKGRVFLVHIPGAAQSQISVVHLGPARRSPRYFENAIMSQILGVGFSSRINMNLREAKGYSYGARGGFSYNQFFGRFAAGSGVRTDATAQSVIEILKEIDALKSGKAPATAGELEREKSGTILGLPGNFATSRDVLSMYGTLVYFGLPLDYYDEFVGRVKKVDLDKVAAAARRELKPGEAHILVVGDADAPQIAYQAPTGAPADAPPTAGPPAQAGSNVPMVGKDGKQLTLRQALTSLLADGTIGKGKLVELDADAVVRQAP